MSPLAALLLVVVVLGTPQTGSGLAGDELTKIRELYALASYEEALARLDAAGARVEPERAAQYRALCLLGLSRVVDAERALERLVMEHPGYAIPEAEVPPRLYAMFQNTRQRVVPAAARARYSVAKSAFDAGQFSNAAREFRQVQALLEDATFVADVDGLRDLRMLSEGFLGLAEDEMAKAERAAMPAPEPAAEPIPVRADAAALPTAAPVAVAEAPAGQPVADAATYSPADSLVQGPVDISRRLPPWTPPPPLARMAFRGVLEVIISEEGLVESATLLTPVHPMYDQSLVDAAAGWRFRPATKDGAPVRYRKTFEVVLNRR